MSKIYKITNLLNNKVYIGQTSSSLEKRFNQHVNGPAYCVKLRRAIEKYGKENFVIEGLEEIEESKVDEREIFYIQKYDTINSGYNIKEGGSRGKWNPESVEKMRLSQIKRTEKFKQPVLLLDKDFNIIQEFDSVKEAELKFNSKITPYLKLEKVCFKNFYWIYKNKDFKTQVEAIKNKNKKYKRVIQLDLNDNVIAEFFTMSEAANSVGAKISNISSVCRGLKLTAKGFKWKYKD